MIFGGGFLAMQWLSIFMASLSAAAPLQDAIDSNSANAPSLNDAVLDSNDLFHSSDVAGVSPGLPAVLAFNPGLDFESNSKINSGILDTSTSRSNSDSTIYDLSHLGSSINLDEPIPNGLFNSAPLALAPNSEIPELASNTVENPTAVDPATGTDTLPIIAQNSEENPTAVDPGIGTDNPQIIAQNTGFCSVPAEIASCPNPKAYISPPRNGHPDDKIEYTDREIEHNNAISAKDERYLVDNVELNWDIDFRGICQRYGSRWRILPVCCFGPETLFIRLETWLVRVTNQGNCVTFSPLRPRCANIHDRFCCESLRTPMMRWGWEGLNCVPAH